MHACSMSVSREWRAQEGNSRREKSKEQFSDPLKMCGRA